MQKILFAGEVFPTKHLNYWRKHIPHAMFVNLYGPIEITLDCTYYIVEKDFNFSEGDKVYWVIKKGLKEAVENTKQEISSKNMKETDEIVLSGKEN